MIPNYWKALIKKGVITEKDYFEKVEPCNVLIKRAKDRLISEFLPFIESSINMANTMLSHSKKSRKYELHNTIEDLIDECMEAQKQFGEYHLEKWEGKLK